MMKLYKYIFYRLYTWNLKTWGKNDAPEWNAALGISMLMALNLFIIYGVVDVFSVKSVFSERPKTFLIFGMILLIFFNYILFVYKRKYLKICEFYRNETKIQKRKRTIMIYLYLLFSIIILLILVKLKWVSGFGFIFE